MRDTKVIVGVVLAISMVEAIVELVKRDYDSFNEKH